MNTFTTRKTLLTGIAFAAIVAGILIQANRLGAEDEPMPYAPGAFGLWGYDWPTAGGDAQRSSSVKNDRWISRATVAKPGPHLIYKVALENTQRQMNSLTQTILVQNARGITGFKSMAFIAGSSGNFFGFDYDTGQQLWKNAIGAGNIPGEGTPACPGGNTAAFTRPVTLTPPVLSDTEAGRGNAPGNLPGARKSGGAVGTPGQGAPIVNALLNAPPAAGRGVAGGGFGASGRGPGGGGGRGTSGIFGVGADGIFHQLSMQQGFDVVTQPVNFLPANANISGLIIVDNVAYAATSGNCGGVANGVWALDFTSAAKTVTSWKTNGGSIAGNVGAAFGSDGILYAATGDGDYTPAAFSNSVVSLEPKTLKLRDYFTPGKSEFTSSPVVFSYKGRDLVAVSNRDGRIYLLDSASLGGADHKTPLAMSEKLTAGDAPGALASWADSSGTRWVLAPTANAIAAFKVVDQNGKPSLTPAWTSRELVSPVAPVVVNGVAFALSTGELRSRQQSQPAVLYALDAVTGKELWNSGKTITSFSPRSAGLSASTGQVYVVTGDNSLYAFGFEAKENE